MMEPELEFPAWMLPAIAALIVALVLLVVRAWHVTRRDVEWLAGAEDVPLEESVIYSYHLRRHRTWRAVGGVVGATFGAIVGAGWYYRVQVGVGGPSPLADVAYCSLAGVIVGALLAESYRLRRPSEPVSVASLSPEAHPPVSRPDIVLTARVTVAVAAALALAAGFVLHDFSLLLVAVIGLILLLLAEATQRAIRGRERPVLSDRAARVDGRLRNFSSARLAWLELAAACLTLAWIAPTAIAGTAGKIAHTGVVLPLGWGLQAVGVIATIVCLFRASPRPSLSVRLGYRQQSQGQDAVT